MISRILLSAVTAVSLLVTAPALAQTNQLLTVETNMGSFEIEIDVKNAPITGSNFLSYVSSKFFDQLLFHRVVKNFVIQGGGLTLDMVEKETLPPIINESKNGLSNLRGSLGMARTDDPNSATSQFYINLKDNVRLDFRDEAHPGYAVFGRVVSGMELIDRMAEVPTTTIGEYENAPIEPIVILSVRQKRIE